MKYEQRYFEKIYKEEPSSPSSLEDFPLQKEDLPQVSDSHRYIANLPFSPRDFHTALKQLNKNKSPGSDGLTPEFYLAFWDVLADPYYQCFLFSLQDGKLSQEQRVGIISLVPKRSGDRTKLSNWRPITLLNTDFKIFSKALANKIQPCIGDVIAEDQTGFIRGRTIATNILNIQTVIDYVNITDSSGILLSVDNTKAFDKVRWSIIHKALEMFGFGEAIISAVRLLFSEIKTCIYNSGFSSDYFSPSCGIRQGCCCSPSLFVIAVELLAILVRRADNVKGITVADQQKKISHYADDATFFIKEPSSLRNLIKLLESFATHSGLKINNSKSHIILLGNHLHPPSQVQGIRIVDSVTILGITVANNMTEDMQYRLNFQQKLEKIRSICNTWWHRNLSLKGKVVLINSLLISILQYPCTCTATPTRVIEEFRTIIIDFLWNHGRSKISYNLMIQDIQHGGLRLADLESRNKVIHLNWVKYLWNHPTSVTARMIQENVGIQNMEHILLCKSDHTLLLENRQLFLRQIFKTWTKLHISPPASQPDVQAELLWYYNKYIQVGMQTLFWKKWNDAGIMHINDLLHDAEPRFCTSEEMRNKFGISTTFLEILQLRTAIPAQWKRKLTGTATQNLANAPSVHDSEDTSVNILRKSSKQLYLIIVRFKKPPVPSQAKWNEIFPISEETRGEYWAEIYKRPNAVGRDTKLQSFQLRLCHRILPCNKFLKNIRIRQDDKCSYCQNQDSIQHFLFLCPPTRAFWKTVCSWLETQVEIQMDMSTRAFLFGVPLIRPQDKVVNFLLLFFKFYIYRQKLFHKGQFCLIQFLRELRSRLNIEKYLTRLDNKTHLFAPWNRIYSALG